MITFKKSYGVDDNIDYRLLYVDKIVLSNYKNPNNIERFMYILGNKYKFYQYNCDKLRDSDYFFWQYVDNDNKKNYQSVEITYNRHLGVKNVYYMQKLLDFITDSIKEYELEIDVIWYENDIRKLIHKIESGEE